MKVGALAVIGSLVAVRGKVTINSTVREVPLCFLQTVGVKQASHNFAELASSDEAKPDLQIWLDCY